MEFWGMCNPKPSRFSRGYVSRHARGGLIRWRKVDAGRDLIELRAVLGIQQHTILRDIPVVQGS